MSYVKTLKDFELEDKIKIIKEEKTKEDLLKHISQDGEITATVLLEFLRDYREEAIDELFEEIAEDGDPDEFYDFERED